MEHYHSERSPLISKGKAKQDYFGKTIFQVWGRFKPWTVLLYPVVLILVLGSAALLEFRAYQQEIQEYITNSPHLENLGEIELEEFVGQHERDDADYEMIANTIRERMPDASWDDGSFAPLLFRLGWHSSGTYSQADGTGGSNGATMRFMPESAYDADKGLGVARDFLDLVKDMYPEISYSDLWILASYVAIEALGGPKIEFQGGRADAVSGMACPVDGRLPDGNKGADHIRSVFNRMGFEDREIVALIGGGHTVGRMHHRNSAWDGPWDSEPLKMDQGYFHKMLRLEWVKSLDPVSGSVQYRIANPTDAMHASIVMMPADMALVFDPEFRKYVELYSNDMELWHSDFAVAFKRLTELGFVQE